MLFRSFLGLNGIVVKSHGGTDAEGFAAAVELGYQMARNNILDKISSDLAAFHGRVMPVSEPNALPQLSAAKTDAP